MIEFSDNSGSTPEGRCVCCDQFSCDCGRCVECDRVRRASSLDDDNVCRSCRHSGPMSDVGAGQRGVAGASKS